MTMAMKKADIDIATPRKLATQHGVAAVEFALIVFVLLLIIAGIVEFGRAFWYYDALSKGTRNAARMLSATPTVNLGTAVAADLQTIVVDSAEKARIPSFTSANVSYSCAPIACSAATSPGSIDYVTVQATYTLVIGSLVPFISSTGVAPLWTVTFTPYTTMKYMY